MKQKVTIHQLYDILEAAVREYPGAMIETIFAQTKSPFFTIIATLLSARTKDSTTEKKLLPLWDQAKTPDDFIAMPLHELEKLLYPIGFYKTKAKYIRNLSLKVKNELDYTIPHTIEGLLTLPGVGRKTANLVLSVAFDIPAICVDTHVHRIMNHLGYVKTSTPEETEKTLREKLPVELWKRTNSIFVKVGQYLANHRSIHDPSNILNKYEITD